MHNQSDTPNPSVSQATAICLAISAVAGAGLFGLLVIDVTTPLDPARGITGLLAAVCSVFGFGYISRSAEDRRGRREKIVVNAILDRIDQGERAILDRIDRMEERMDEHAANLAEQGQETQASVFVGNIAGSRHLTTVPRQG